MADKTLASKLNIALQNCKIHKDLPYAMLIYSQMCEDGMDMQALVGNYVVPMFVECCSMLEARFVFDRLLDRTMDAWTYIILGYTHMELPHQALELYERMQEQGAQTSSYMLVTLLKACGKLNDIERGKDIHTETIMKGFETDLLVGSTLTDMYAKCGLPFEAQKVFQKLLERDIVLWNVLLSGYADYGLDKEAFECFGQMHPEGTSPNSTTFVCLLKVCGSIGDTWTGQELHAYAVQKGLEVDCFVGNTVVDMYGRCGLHIEAEDVFDKLSVKNVVSWTALIAGYMEHQETQKALDVYGRMKLEGVTPNVVTFTSILKACGSQCNKDRGHELHVEITQKGFDKEHCIGNSLLDLYVKCGMLIEAHRVFDMVCHRTLITWNTMLSGFAEHEQGEEGAKYFELMQQEGFSPDVVTYVCILKACCGMKDREKNQLVHTEVTMKGLELESVIGSTLVDVYAKSRLLVEAQEVFEQLKEKNVVAWNNLIGGYAECGLGQECLDCFVRMRSNNVIASAVTFVSVLKECGSRRLYKKGQEIHSDILRVGCDVDSFVGNTLVDMYARCGSLLDARKVFVRLCAPDLVSWNALITGYAQHGPDQEALDVFEHMQAKGVYEDATTFVSVLKACGNVGAIDLAKSLHAKIMHRGNDNDVFLGGTLIDVYAKCGALTEAKQVFNKVGGQNVVLWNAMIMAHGVNHEVDMAVQVFTSMQEQGVRPDAITFMCLLTACSRASLVESGQELLKAMTLEYGNTLTSDHFASVVDLLARSGHVCEARKYLNTIPCSPSKVTWTALLNACRNHGEAGSGATCFEQLVQIKPDCASCYVLMSNICASDSKLIDDTNLKSLVHDYQSKEYITRQLFSGSHSVGECSHNFDKPKETTITAKVPEGKLIRCMNSIYTVEKNVSLCLHTKSCLSLQVV